MRTIPRWGALILWPLTVPLVLAGVPIAIASLDEHHGWHDGSPAVVNRLGLVPLAAGTALVVWVLAGHYRAAPTEGWPLQRGVGPAYRPEYLLVTGPYARSRNPLYVAEDLLLLGWAVLLGSVAVAGVLVVFHGLQQLIIRFEERRLGEDFGDLYRDYCRAVPRWWALSAGWRRPRGTPSRS